jgi:hypothetical protein
MNRRGFFTTLFAAPAATLVALKAKAAPPTWEESFRDAVLKPFVAGQYDAFAPGTMGVGVQADLIPSGKDEVVIHLRVEGTEEATATLRELERRVEALDRSLTRARAMISNQELRRTV